MSIETPPDALRAMSNTVTLEGLEEHRFAAGALRRCNDDISTCMAEFLVELMSTHSDTDGERLTTTFAGSDADRAFFDISCGLMEMAYDPLLTSEHLLALNALMASLQRQYHIFLAPE
jgi:hypothetical protein